MTHVAPTSALSGTSKSKPPTGGGTAAAPAHYTAVAESYEAAFFYSSPEYRSWVLERLLLHFRLQDEVWPARRRGPLG
jgi:hypothetical protein